MTMLATTAQAWATAAERASRGVTAPSAALAVPAPFQLNAVVVSVHDGDTINVIVDWGKRRYEGNAAHPQPIRLLGCNARELGTDGGDAARDALAALLPVGTPVVLRTISDDRYPPRWDCAVTFLLGKVPVDLVGLLVEQQWVAPWNGAGERPLPPWPRPVA